MRIRNFLVLFLLMPVIVQAQTVHQLTIDEAINQALKKGEEVQLAKSTAAQAASQVEVARSQYFPQLSATGTYTRTLQSQYSNFSKSISSLGGSDSGKSSTSAFSSLPFGQANQYSVGLQASETLYAGGRISAQNRAADAQKASAEIGMRSTLAQVELSVVQAYYSALLTDELVQIAKDQLDQAQRVYDQTRLSFKVGKAAEYDALRSKVTRDNQIPVVLQAENNQAQAYDALKTLLNLPLADSLELTSPLTASNAQYREEADTSVNARASVRQAIERVRGSEAQVSIAGSDAYPQISVSSKYAPVAYPKDFLPSLSDFTTDWTVSLNVSIPIYTGGSIAGNRAAAEANVESAKIQLAQTKEATRADVRSSRRQLESARATLAATASTVAEAERAYSIAKVRFDQGLSTQVDLDDARIQEAQARTNHAKAMRDFAVAQARLALLNKLPVSTSSSTTSGSGF